jgi:glycosyltransferase involved in cell wall biosynthesis
MFRLLSQEPDPAQVRVVSLTGGGNFRERLESLGVSVACLEMRPGLPSPFKWWQLVRLLRKWQPQLVQTWMYHADLLGGVAALVAGVPVCWGIRNSDLSPERNRTSTRFVAWMCAHLSRRIPAHAISCSARAAEIHRSIGYAVPFTVVPNGFPVDDWKPHPEQRDLVRGKLGYSRENFVFAHAGRNDPQKNHVGLALAFNRIFDDNPSAKLLLCGASLAPETDYFRALPFTNRARNAVLAMGSRDDLPHLWQAADAFVLSSIGEAFPNVVAEAMACGLPCVVTDVGDAAEIVGDTGLVVPPGDYEALAEAMLALCTMSVEKRHRLGAAARQRVLERFTLDRMAAGFRGVWNDVIAGGVTQCAD